MTETFFFFMDFSPIQNLTSQPFWLLLPLTLAFLSLLKSSLKILNWVFINFLRPSKNLKKYGSWVLVTGPTDGIGKAFAYQLAHKGLNLVLVGRNPEKLNNVSDSIRAKFKHTEIKIAVVDFCGDLAHGIEMIRGIVDDLDVGVLINNVGASYPYARYFHEVDDKLLKDVIKVNVEATTKVTHVVLPGMIKRKKGAIVNIGSGIVIVLPSDPFYTLYAATKAYIDQFSRSLHVEYKKSGIDVQCQVPLGVATKLASLRTTSFFVASPDDYARAAIRCIGYEQQCTPYWTHSILFVFARLFPKSVLEYWWVRYCLTIRKKGKLKDLKRKKMN